MLALTPADSNEEPAEATVEATATAEATAEATLEATAEATAEAAEWRATAVDVDCGTSLAPREGQTAQEPAAKPTAHYRTLRVPVPPGAKSGQPLLVRTPEGTLVQVTVPNGLEAGAYFDVLDAQPSGTSSSTHTDGEPRELGRKSKRGDGPLSTLVAEMAG